MRRYEGSEEPYQYKPTSSDDIYGEMKTSAAKESLLDCIMDKEIFRKGNLDDIQKLKDMVIQSKLDTRVKCDLMEYIAAEKEKAIESLQKLVYDFLEAGQAISLSSGINNLSGWVHSVVDRLAPSIQEYSRKQIDWVVALILLEQSERDTSYRDVLNRFTEIYKNEGGVF